MAKSECSVTMLAMRTIAQELEYSTEKGLEIQDYLFKSFMCQKHNASVTVVQYHYMTEHECVPNRISRVQFRMRSKV